MYVYKFRCNPVHPLNGALPGPYVAVGVTSGALVAHRYIYAPPRCRTSQCSKTFICSRCPSGTILLTTYSMVWDWRVSRAGPMLFCWPKLHYPCYNLLLFFSFSSSCLKVGIVGLGSSDCIIVCISPSLSLALPIFFIIIIIIIITEPCTYNPSTAC